MGGRLTTHVLNTAAGKPAAGMKISLWRIGGDGTRERLLAAATNSDGRVDRPLLEGDAFEQGEYELLFEVGRYFRDSQEEEQGGVPVFLEDVPVRFRISDSATHYHVPLLVAPGGYSTYRGS
jgi:5-hydroxyisourate hydrolase